MCTLFLIVGLFEDCIVYYQPKNRLQKIRFSSPRLHLVRLLYSSYKTDKEDQTDYIEIN